MPTVQLKEIKISSVVLSPTQVNVSQTFKLSVGVVEDTFDYKYEDAPLLGDAQMTTDSSRQIRHQIREV